MATPEELVRLTIAALLAVWSEWATSLPQHTDWEIGAAYVRESSAKSLEGIQPSVQLRAILDNFARKHIFVPWELVFFDNRSGTELETRSGLMALIAKVEVDPTIRHIGAFESDRLFRNVEDHSRQTNDWRRRGVRVHIPGMPDLDERLPSTWQMEQTQAQFSEYHSRTTSFKVGTNLQAASRSGIPVGTLPEGYRVAERGPGLNGRTGRPSRWEQSQPLAGIIRQGGKLYLRGKSYAELSRWAESTELHGVTPKGKPMTREWWRSTLLNPKYAGYHMATDYQGYKPGKIAPKRPRRTADTPLIPCALPPIFTMEETREIQGMSRARRARSPGRRSSQPSELSGLLVDDRCGHRVHVQSRQGDDRRVYCRVASMRLDRHATSFFVRDVEQDMDALVSSLTFNDEAFVLAVEKELERLGPRDFDRAPSPTEREIARYRRILADLDPNSDAVMRVGIEARLGELGEVLDHERRVAVTPGWDATVADLKRWPEVWAGAPASARSRLLRKALREVRIAPEGRLPRGRSGADGDKRPRTARIVSITPKDPIVGLALATALASKLGMERETGFEPATFCLGSRHSAS